MITLYTIGCPQCDVLKAKLDKKHIKYSVVSDRETLKQKGFTVFPILEIDGKRLEFIEANNWVNTQGEQRGN